MQYDFVYMISGRLYCPSTDEVIITLDEMMPINEEAKALIAFWYNEIMDDPVCNNEVIRNAWQDYLGQFEEDTRHFDLYEKLSTFLEEYEAPGWRTYQIETSGMACGPVSHTDWFVVLKDTVIEGNGLEDEEIN